MPIITPIPIPIGPNVPNSNDPEVTFDAQFEASLTWQRDELTPKANDLASATYNNALFAEVSASNALVSETTASEAADTSLGSANYKGKWSALTGALNKPASVSHNGNTWLLTENLANVTTEIPGISTKWELLSVSIPVSYASNPTNTVRNNAHIVITYAGATTVTLPPLFEGSYVVITVLNNRADNVIDRNGALIEDIAENVLLDEGNQTYNLCGISNGVTLSWRFV